MRINKHLLIAIAVLTGLSLSWFFEAGTNPPVQASASIFDAAYAAVAKGRIDIEGGVIRLAAQRDGLIQEVMVEEGMRVKKGEILATMDSRQAAIGVGLAKAELEQAKAQARLLEVRAGFADRDARRSTGAASEGALPVQAADDKRTVAKAMRMELQAARSAVAKATANLAQAEFEIEVRKIRAPFDGRIVKRNAKPGDGISTLNITELFQLAPIAPRIVRADVDEQFIDNVRVGMDAEIISETNPDHKWQGKVMRIGEVFGSRKPTDDPNERQDVRVVDTVLSLNGEAVRIGQRVLVKILADSKTTR